MNRKLYVSPAPHVTRGYSTTMLMFAMIIALTPTAVLGVINFGMKALWIILISVGSSYVFELLFKLMSGRRFYIDDISSIVTGYMTALVLPVSVPYWMPVVAAFIATVIFKCFFGGVGRNLFNPTAAARVLLAFVFTGLSMSMFTGTALGANVTSPLAYFMQGDFSSITLRSLFFGTTTGAIGTACILCIVVTGVLLMCFRITDYIIPIASIIAFVAITWGMGGAIAILPFLFSGSFLFAAFFMAPDPTTSPLTIWGKLLYGLIFGLLAGLFRCRFVLGETSVFVALLIVNILSPMLDKIFAPRPLGRRRRA